MTHTHRTTRFTALILTGLLACNGADLVLPDEGEPASVAILEGNDQSGRAGESLSQPVVALVTDSRGRPVAGVELALTLDDRAGGAVEPERARTGGDGTVAFQIVLGARVGAVSGRVAVVPPEGDPSITAPVRLTALGADAAGLTAVSGDGQSAPVATTLPEPLVVRVADVFGNPVAGIEITWTAEGGGSVSESTVTTDADGRAQVARTLGPSAGAQLTTASAEGLAGSPVTFTATATAGSAATLDAVSGDGQSAVVGTPLPNELVVRLLDPEGNPVAGTAVAWVVGQGAGTVAPQTIPTDADGKAATRWTLGSLVGSQTVTAVVSGVGVVGFTATAQPGTPPGLRLATQPSATARHGLVLGRQPVVQLVDPTGAVLRQAGVSVTVAVAAGGGTVRGTLTRSTNDDGRAGFTDLRLEGPAGQYTLAFSSPGYTGIVSSPIDLQPATTTLTIDSDDPDPSAPGQPVTIRFGVASPGGSPTGDVVVTSGGLSCTASVAVGACDLTFSQAGTVTITASYPGSEGFAGDTDEEQHTVAAIVPPGPSASASSVTVEPATVAIGDAARVQVTVRDAAGSPLSGVDVTLSLSGSGGQVSPASDRTSGSGLAEFTVRSSVAESVTITAVADGVTLDQRPVLVVSRATSETRIDGDSPDPSDIGEAVLVRVSVRGDGGTPSGQVAVTGTGGLSCQITLSGGAGSCTLTPTASGPVTLRADYAGDAAFLPSGATEDHTVRSPPARILTIRTEPSGSAIPGEPFERQPEVQLSLEGGGEIREAGVVVRVAVSAGGALLGGTSATTGDDGRVRFDDLAIAGDEGTYRLTFSADGFAPVTSDPIELRRETTRTEITADDPDPSISGESVEVGFRVRGDGGTPTGTVTVSDPKGGTSCVGSLDGGGEGSCRLALTSNGRTTITAAYGGDSRFGPSSGEERHQVR